RYRQVPTFGPATIRNFSANSSGMKCMAARNSEDLLQCSIPVFNGLLPEPHNSSVLQLLFTMAHWHGLAKLRMHSDWTLEIMDQVTSTVSQQFRDFKATVCLAYAMHELCQEVKARSQCSKHKSNMLEQGVVVVESQTSTKNAQCTKTFNFQTYKFHALGDYVSTICQYGTSDLYSSKPVSPENVILHT
ncbi:hypothetical protein EV424DRAFT_1309316, partial [Suillus variegatus]